MRTLPRAALLALVVVASAGCGSSIPFDLVFPSQETFLISVTGEVQVYQPEPDMADEVCRNLSAGLPAGLSSVAGTGSIHVCEFQANGIELIDVPVGRLVFFAEIQGDVGRIPIMKGCTVADVYANTTEPVRVQLSTLPTYPDNPNVTCAGVDAKCVDLQSCQSGG